jgi:hypothetical protein
VSGFPRLCAAAHLLPTEPGATLGDADLVRLICSDCPFYKEGVDEELECGAFMLLRHLLRRKVVSVQAIVAAVSGGDTDGCGSAGSSTTRGEE